MNIIINENLLNKLKYWLSDIIDNVSQLYLVGGTVRDLIINRSQNDIDLICFNAKKTAQIIAHKRGAALVYLDNKINDCFRIVNRKNPLDYIDITEIKNNSITCDLQDRDFTINAMALKINKDYTFELVDNCSGVNDIKNKLIKNVSNESFKSDPLRILRAIRFQSQLGYKIELNTEKNLIENLNLLKNVASERILYELKIILSNNNSYFYIKKMDQLKILEIIFPEIIDMKQCSQNWFHDKNVWNHCLETYKFLEEILNNINDYFPIVKTQINEYLNKENKIQILKLAALFHDIGKPKTFNMIEDTGRITFHNHPIAGKMIIEDLAIRLRLSNSDYDYLSILVSEHLHTLELSQKKVRKSTLMKWIRNYKDRIISLLILGIADKKATSGPMSCNDEKEKFIKWATNILTEYFNTIKEKINQKDLITGNDLIKMNLKPGPEFGIILNKIREARDDKIISSREEALLMVENLVSR